MKNDKFEKLISDMGYDYKEIITLFNMPRFEKIFKNEVERNLSVSLLLGYMNSFGFKKEETIAIIKKCPYMFSLNVESLDEKLNFWLKSLEYSKDELKSMISSAPPLLILSKESILKHLSVFEHLGYTKDETKEFSSKNPIIFTHNIDYIIHKDEFYRSIGFNKIFVKSEKSIYKPIENVKVQYQKLVDNNILVTTGLLFSRNIDGLSIIDECLSILKECALLSQSYLSTAEAALILEKCDLLTDLCNLKIDAFNSLNEETNIVYDLSSTLILERYKELNIECSMLLIDCVELLKSYAALSNEAQKVVENYIPLTDTSIYTSTTNKKK